MTKHRFVCFLVSCFLMIGMFPSNLLAYTIDGKDVYEYSDGSIWVDDFYYGWNKFPEIRFSDSGNGIFFSFDLSNDAYHWQDLDTEGNISCYIYECEGKKVNYTKFYATANGIYSNGRGNMQIPTDSFVEGHIYQLAIRLNYLPAYTVEFIVENGNVYFNRMNRDYATISRNSKENYEAYIRIVDSLDEYGAYNFLKDYKESYLSQSDINSYAEAKKLVANSVTDYEKVNTIAEWIYKNIVYDASSLVDENRSRNADEVLEKRNGACSEHAILLRAMLNAVDIPCLYISSSISNHAWNMAYVDHRWVWVDCTGASMSDNAFSLYETYIDAEIDNRYKYFKVQNGDNISQGEHGNDSVGQGEHKNDSVSQGGHGNDSVSQGEYGNDSISQEEYEDDSICEVHQWDEGYVILEPTCLIEGTVQYCCKKCHDIKIVTLPAKAHDYGPWKTVVSADTKNEGMEQRECKYCGNVEKRVIPVVVKRNESTKKNVAATKKISGIAKKYCLKVGQKMLLKPVIKPANSTDKLIYKSSKPVVATVNKKGKVTAIKKGTSVITIKSGKKKIQCKIIVR